MWGGSRAAWHLVSDASACWVPGCRLLPPEPQLPPPPRLPAVLFLFWAYTPGQVLEAHGITYYPSKYWAVALPTWLCVTVVYVFWAYERWALGLVGGWDQRCGACVQEQLPHGTPDSMGHVPMGCCPVPCP